ncbi:MAG: PssD/Cps14F family polysaccharide biosynthesis glycosyltransferase [Sedimentisphaerales bacterium]|jgi:UDP-N-acetylglucosamine:LPS N-acetylglucosamine transferase
MPERKILRICLVASAGGHLSQLLKLAECWNGYDTFCVTTKQIVKEQLQKYGNVYIVGECNRQNPFMAVRVFFRCFNVVRQERPDVVISTGAAPGLLMCLVAKLFGAKIVWIDSIANVEKLSLSGRLVRPLAELCLTQWEDVATRYAKVEYVGAII